MQSILSPPIATPPVTPELNYKKFGDVKQTRQLIFDNIMKAAQNIEPVVNKNYKLSIEKPAWKGATDYSIADQKNALLSRGTITRKLVGNAVLRDLDDNVIDSRPIQLAKVPYFTNRGTFILNGNEYTMSHQMRLRPGIFTRQKQNGEYESHVNVSKGYGHKLSLDPKSGVFNIEMGQAKIPLLPLLRAMGVTDSEVRKTWGDQLAASNVAKARPDSISRLYKKIYKNKDVPEANQAAAVIKAFEEMELDAEVTKHTLGKEVTNVNKDTILEITKKLLKVARGEEAQDDRDSMAFQRMFGPEDLFAERLSKSKNALRKVLWKASVAGNLAKMPTNIYQDAIQSTLLNSGLGMPLEEINPADIFDQQFRVTRMGKGGIESMDAVPDEARSVQPSQFGFIDFLRTPECYDAVTEVMTQAGWKHWTDVTEDDKFACLIDGKLSYHHADKLIKQHYQGIMYGADTGRINYLVTPNHRLWVSPMFKGAQYRIETAEECHESFRRVCSGGFGEYSGDSTITEFKLPQLPIKGNNTAVVDSVPIGPWAELMGWWLGEGNTVYKEETFCYNIKIAQSNIVNPSNCDRIQRVLNELPFAYTYSAQAFMLATKQLAAYFKNFGGSHQRYIPDYLLHAPLHARKRLYAALMLGEGRKNRRGERTQFCTTSERLADDFVKLAFGLGIATRKVYEPDSRSQSNHGGAWVIHVHKHNEHQVIPNRKGSSDYYTTSFDGDVYCATVPGGLLYVRRGDTVGHWSGNSGKVGVDARIARKAVKGADGKIYTQVKDKKGELIYKSPQELSESVISFPNELGNKSNYAAALVNGKVTMVPKAKVDFEIPDMEGTFSPLGNMVPMKSAVKGQRAVMASRMFTQALAVQDAEAPWVQSGIPDAEDQSFEEEYAKYMGAIKADYPARVVSTSDKEIVIENRDGEKEKIELYHNFPYNRKSFIHQEAMVKPGDVVKPGQLLAKSNFTDKNGVTALGKNARVAYIPWKGLNFEDAIVISKGFADRMSSEHMYQQSYEWESTDHKGKNAFVSIFPTAYDKATLSKFDDDGVIKPGTVVNKDDPLMLVAKERARNKKSLLKGGKSSYKNDSQLWEHHQPGVVTDVVKNNKGISVVTKSIMPMDVGDKLSGRYGGKGIIAKIIPDDEMPQLSDGKPAEVLLNPLGVISRTNPAQIIETVLGKIAQKTGKAYKLKDFKDIEDLVEFAKKELRREGLKDTESIIDPESSRKIDNILTGSRWFMKLHHTAESKSQGRGLGSYTSDMVPAKGGKQGSKRVGMLESNALLSHGATSVIRDTKLVRGQSNTDYWAQYMSGYKPPTPGVPLVYKKFVNSLKSAGINVVRDNNRVHIMALTDKDIDRLSEDREIKNVSTVDWKNMEPIKGGLFDKNLTGGHYTADGGGNRWSFIRLTEPMPSPVMEEPIRRLLGLTKNDFAAVISGKKVLQDKTGPGAITAALNKIDIDKEINQARADIASGKKTYRDKAVRKLGYLKSAKRLGIHPKEWVLSKVPVLPPAFRPISVMGGKGLPLVADPNYLYKELWDANTNLADLNKELGDDHTGEEKLTLYNTFKAVTGLGDPTHPKNKERNVKGILKHIFGSSPKLGIVQRKLLSASSDMVGRSVIAPDPDLDMDQVAIPEEQAWVIYKPKLMHALSRRGVAKDVIVNAIENKTKLARDVLLDEMEKGVVLISRAPTLHKYGIMAARPKLTKGDVLKVSPLVVSGFNADFDGDAMNYYVPIQEDAQEEAIEKMLPSRNLFAASNFDVHYTPSQEYVGGLYEASSAINKRQKPVVFSTAADAIKAFKSGRINVDTRIEIINN